MAAPCCLWDVAAELGERPVWVARERTLFFVDILRRTIYRRGEDGRCSWLAPAAVGLWRHHVRGCQNPRWCTL